MPKYIIIIGLVVLACLMCAESHCGAMEDVEAFVRSDRQGMNQRRTELIVDHIVPAIVGFSEKAGVDPLLVATLMSTESSYNPFAVGKAGEIGLLQVKPRWFRKAGIKHITMLDQIEVGIRILKNCIDSCRGDILGGLTLYHMGGQGGCGTSSARARYKYRLYTKAKGE